MILTVFFHSNPAFLLPLCKHEVFKVNSVSMYLLSEILFRRHTKDFVNCYLYLLIMYLNLMHIENIHQTLTKAIHM